jgi:dimethylaniline monooxygenase (N-oxide forming)
MPYINRPYRNRPAFLDYISRYIDPPEDSPPITNFTVDLAPFPSHFLPSGRAVFPISKRKDSLRMASRDVRPDTVIYATGYTQDFSFFNKDDHYATPSEADLRNVAKSGDETIGFIGFVRPGVGAIPPIAEMQSFFWISLLKMQVKQPLVPPHYHLLVKDTARIKYGVEYVILLYFTRAPWPYLKLQPRCIYEHFGEGYWCCTRVVGAMARVQDACFCMLLVRTLLVSAIRF